MLEHCSLAVEEFWARRVSRVVRSGSRGSRRDEVSLAELNSHIEAMIADNYNTFSILEMMRV